MYDFQIFKILKIFFKKAIDKQNFIRYNTNCQF